jgi:hypothetical protein
MDNQTWKEKIKNAKCPEKWTYNLLGECTSNGIRGLRFYPGTSNIELLNSIKCKDDYTPCNLDLYTHGIIIWITDKHIKMTYEQIVDIDLVPYEEPITFRETIFNHMGTGIEWGAYPGMAIGAAVGAITQMTRKNKMREGKILRIAFWDADTKELKYILFDYPKPDVLENFLASWQREKIINEETGRMPTTKSSGCLSVIIILFISTILCSFILFK